MKKTTFAILALAMSISFAHAKDSSTECTFKKNPRNKIYLKFEYNGNQLDTAEAMLFIQTGTSVSSFTYYNYAFMTRAMSYREYIPYGRRAEFVNFVEDVERAGKLNFQVVNYAAKDASVLFNSRPMTKKAIDPVRGKRRFAFDAVLQTVLKTENTPRLENGSTLSVNDVSCILTEL